MKEMVMHVTITQEASNGERVKELQNALVEMVGSKLRKDPSRLIITLTFSELQKFQDILSDIDSGRLFTPDPRVQATAQAIAWKCRFIHDSSRAYGGAYQVYAVVIKPGVIDALREGLLARIHHEMKHHDIDECVSVTYPPMSLYANLYTANVQEAYEKWVHDWVEERLRSERIEFTVCAGEYLCQRA